MQVQSQVQQQYALVKIHWNIQFKRLTMQHRIFGLYPVVQQVQAQPILLQSVMAHLLFLAILLSKVIILAEMV